MGPVSGSVVRFRRFEAGHASASRRRGSRCSTSRCPSCVPRACSSTSARVSSAPAPSAATVETGRKSLLAKARARPDQARLVLDKARRDGLGAAASAVRFRLDQPAALGYSSAGVVLAVGEPRHRSRAGRPRRVRAAPATPCTPRSTTSRRTSSFRSRRGSSFEDAAFATVGAIALHGVRQADVAAGRAGRRDRARARRASSPGRSCARPGAASSASTSTQPRVERALARRLRRRCVRAQRARRRAPGGRGGLRRRAHHRGDVRRPIPSSSRRACAATGAASSSSATSALDLPREAYYEKELELRRLALVRPGPLRPPSTRSAASTTRSATCAGPSGATWRRSSSWSRAARCDVGRPRHRRGSRSSDAAEAYERSSTPDSSPLGVLHRVRRRPPSRRAAPAAPADRRARAARSAARRDRRGQLRAGSSSPASRTPASRSRPSRARAASRPRARASGSGSPVRRRAEELLADPRVGLVAVATRHGSHAALAARALRAGKCVFVEKPPAL